MLEPMNGSKLRMARVKAIVGIERNESYEVREEFNKKDWMVFIL